VSANVTLVPPPKGMITTLCSLAKFTSLTTSSWQPRKKYKKALYVRHTLDAYCDAVYLLASLMIDTRVSFSVQYFYVGPYFVYSHLAKQPSLAAERLYRSAGRRDRPECARGCGRVGRRFPLNTRRRCTSALS
jgi:hypothetical protein